MKLYNYWRSSASWRVRLGLAFKEIAYDYVPVNLATGEHRAEAYIGINPASEVPLLEIDDLRLGQSLVILQYLDERFPDRPLLPATQPERAYALQIAEAINASIHPLQNLRVMKKLEADFAFDDGQKAAWAKHFITQGFTGVEALLARHAGTFAVGERFTIADCFITPQVYNARRYGVDMSAFPLLSRIDAAVLALPAAVASHPSAQNDAPKT